MIYVVKPGVIEFDNLLVKGWIARATTPEERAFFHNVASLTDHTSPQALVLFAVALVHCAGFKGLTLVANDETEGAEKITVDAERLTRDFLRRIRSGDNSTE